MSISIDDVEKIAKLAKLKFTNPEKEKLAIQLADILNYVQKLNELDTENVEVSHHVLNIVNVMREDKTSECLTSEQATKNAPKTVNGFFSVPKVISQDNNDTKQN